MINIFRENPDQHKKILDIFEGYKDLNKLLEDKIKIFQNLHNID